MIAVVL